MYHQLQCTVTTRMTATIHYGTLSGIMTDSPDPYTPPLHHDVVGDELLGGGHSRWHSPEQWLNTDENQQHIQSCNRSIW